MKKKLLSALLCVAMVASLVVGCGAKEEAPAEAPAATEEAPAEEEAAAPAEGGYSFEIVSKGFQHAFWQAVYKGAMDKAAELGDSVNFVGPNSESDIADQVQMINNAINAQPAAIGLAALDTNAAMDAITQAQAAGIPIIGFDSGVPGAPEGAIYANAATDNYAAGQLAAEETYKLIGEKVEAGGVRIGVLSQDATGESLISRGTGFIDKMAELAVAAGKTVGVIGNDYFVGAFAGENAGEGADVIIEVLVPSQVTAELSAIDAQTLLNKADTICIYGSNSHSAEALVTADSNIGKLGKDVIGVGFDSGIAIMDAIRAEKLAGAITQAPVAMGAAVVELLHAVASGETVADVDTGCQWYTAANIDDPEIAQNLYE
jgi:ribose transport system substrate-binding protein